MAMERELTSESNCQTAENYLFPSRRAAAERMFAALSSGPALVTGEAGIGKSWLVRHICSQTSGDLSWFGVDLTPACRSDDLIHLIGYSLGLEMTAPGGEPRLTLADYLDESTRDGRRLGLWIDEGHAASTDVLEEIRVLSNRLGHAGGLAAMILVAQTSLARRMGLRTLAALEVRLAARVHLQPIDADEALEYLSLALPELELDIELVEDWHRNSGGNPRRLLRLALERRPRAGLTFIPSPRAALRDPKPNNGAMRPVVPAEPIVPVKPPLRVGDGMVEVGWDAESEAERPTEGEMLGAEPIAALADAPVEQEINDHYAALQAWEEWAKNQGRTSPRVLVGNDAAPTDLLDSESINDSASRHPVLSEHPLVWAEGEHEFAPYSQLLSRLRGSHE
jgi:general secretion pathway protein A